MFSAAQLPFDRFFLRERIEHTTPKFVFGSSCWCSSFLFFRGIKSKNGGDASLEELILDRGRSFAAGRRHLWSCSSLFRLVWGAMVFRSIRTWWYSGLFWVSGWVWIPHENWQRSHCTDIANWIDVSSLVYVSNKFSMLRDFRNHFRRIRFSSTQNDGLARNNRRKHVRAEPNKRLCCFHFVFIFAPFRWQSSSRIVRSKRDLFSSSFECSSNISRVFDYTNPPLENHGCGVCSFRSFHRVSAEDQEIHFIVHIHFHAFSFSRFVVLCFKFWCI